MAPRLRLSCLHSPVDCTVQSRVLISVFGSLIYPGLYGTFQPARYNPHPALFFLWTAARPKCSGLHVIFESGSLNMTVFTSPPRRNSSTHVGSSHEPHARDIQAGCGGDLALADCLSAVPRNSIDFYFWLPASSCLHQVISHSQLLFSSVVLYPPCTRPSNSF